MKVNNYYFVNRNILFEAIKLHHMIRKQRHKKNKNKELCFNKRIKSYEQSGKCKSERETEKKQGKIM